MIFAKRKRNYASKFSSAKMKTPFRLIFEVNCYANKPSKINELNNEKYIMTQFGQNTISLKFFTQVAG